MNKTLEEPIVVNKYKESYDIYIGRGSIWGNPYKISSSLTREQSIQKYRQYLYQSILENRITLQDVEALSGCKLGCFCKPKACHGDVILSLWKNRYKVFKHLRDEDGL